MKKLFSKILVALLIVAGSSYVIAQVRENQETSISEAKAASLTEQEIEAIKNTPVDVTVGSKTITVNRNFSSSFDGTARVGLKDEFEFGTWTPAGTTTPVPLVWKVVYSQAQQTGSGTAGVVMTKEPIATGIAWNTDCYLNSSCQQSPYKWNSGSKNAAQEPANNNGMAGKTIANGISGTKNIYDASTGYINSFFAGETAKWMDTVFIPSFVKPIKDSLNSVGGGLNEGSALYLNSSPIGRALLRSNYSTLGNSAQDITNPYVYIMPYQGAGTEKYLGGTYSYPKTWMSYSEITTAYGQFLTNNPNFAPDVTSNADILNGQVSGHPVCYMSTPFDNIYSPIAAQSYNMVTGVLGSANASDTYRRQRPALYLNNLPSKSVSLAKAGALSKTIRNGQYEDTKVDGSKPVYIGDVSVGDGSVGNIAWAVEQQSDTAQADNNTNPLGNHIEIISRGKIQNGESIDPNNSRKNFSGYTAEVGLTGDYAASNEGTSNAAPKIHVIDGAAADNAGSKLGIPSLVKLESRPAYPTKIKFSQGQKVNGTYEPITVPADKTSGPSVGDGILVGYIYPTNADGSVNQSIMDSTAQVTYELLTNNDQALAGKIRLGDAVLNSDYMSRDSDGKLTVYGAVNQTTPNPYPGAVPVYVTGDLNTNLTGYDLKVKATFSDNTRPVDASGNTAAKSGATYSKTINLEGANLVIDNALPDFTVHVTNESKMTSGFTYGDSEVVNGAVVTEFSIEYPSSLNPQPSADNFKVTLPAVSDPSYDQTHFEIANDTKLKLKYGISALDSADYKVKVRIEAADGHIQDQDYTIKVNQRPLKLKFDNKTVSRGAVTLATFDNNSFIISDASHSMLASDGDIKDLGLPKYVLYDAANTAIDIYDPSTDLAKLAPGTYYVHFDNTTPFTYPSNIANIAEKGNYAIDVSPTNNLGTLTITNEVLAESDFDYEYKNANIAVSHTEFYADDITIKPSAAAIAKGYDEISIDDGIHYAASATVSAAGEHKLKTTLRNSQNVNDVSASKEITLNIDKDAPKITNWRIVRKNTAAVTLGFLSQLNSSTSALKNYYDGPVNVEINATDEQTLNVAYSGINSYQIKYEKLDNQGNVIANSGSVKTALVGDPNCSAAACKIEDAITSNGNYEVSITATDKSIVNVGSTGLNGNTSTVDSNTTKTIVVNEYGPSAPTVNAFYALTNDPTNFNIAYQGEWLFQKKVKLSVPSPADGVIRYEYRLANAATNAPWINIDTPIEANGDSVYLVRGVWKDSESGTEIPGANTTTVRIRNEKNVPTFKLTPKTVNGSVETTYHPGDTTTEKVRIYVEPDINNKLPIEIKYTLDDPTDSSAVWNTLSSNGSGYYADIDQNFDGSATFKVICEPSNTNTNAPGKDACILGAQDKIQKAVSVKIIRATLNAPSVDLNGYTSGIWTNTPIKMTVSGGIDDPAYINFYEYAAVAPGTQPDPSANGACWNKVRDANNTITIDSNEEMDYYFRLVTTYGDRSDITAKYEVRFDKVKPLLKTADIVFTTPNASGISQFINMVTFGAWGNTGVDIQMTGSDPLTGNANGIGASSSELVIEYQLVKDGYDLESTWTELANAGSVSVRGTNKWTLHARARDLAGNRSSDIVIPFAVDSKAPVISGAADNAVYYTSKTILLSDDYAGIDYSKTEVVFTPVNGTAQAAQPLTNNQKFSDEGTYQLTAFDLSGNTTSISFTITAFPTPSDVNANPNHNWNDILEDIEREIEDYPPDGVDQPVVDQQLQDFKDALNNTVQRNHSIAAIANMNVNFGEKIEVNAKIQPDPNYRDAEFKIELLKDNTPVVTQFTVDDNHNVYFKIAEQATAAHAGTYTLQITDKASAVSIAKRSFVVQVAKKSQNDFNDQTYNKYYEANGYIELDRILTGSPKGNLSFAVISNNNVLTEDTAHTNRWNITNTGTATFKVTAAGNTLYESKDITLTININKSQNELVFTEPGYDNVEITYGDSNATPIELNDMTNAVFDSDNESVATVEYNPFATGQQSAYRIVAHNVGETTITAVAGDGINTEIRTAELHVKVVPKQITLKPKAIYAPGSAIPTFIGIDQNGMDASVSIPKLGTPVFKVTDPFGQDVELNETTPAGAYKVKLTDFEPKGTDYNNYKIDMSTVVDFTIRAVIPTDADYETDPMDAKPVGGTASKWFHQPITVTPIGYDEVSISKSSSFQNFGPSGEVTESGNYSMMFKKNGVVTDVLSNQPFQIDRIAPENQRVSFVKQVNPSNIISSIAGIAGDLSDDDVFVTIHANDPGTANVNVSGIAKYTMSYTSLSQNGTATGTSQTVTKSVGDQDCNAVTCKFDITTPASSTAYYLIKTSVTDAAGNISVVKENRLVIDKDAPASPVLTATAKTSGIHISSGQWTSSALELKVADNIVNPTISGVKRFEYQTSSDGSTWSGSWQSFPANQTIDISASGFYQVRTVSNIDKESTPVVFEAKIDSVKPQLTVTPTGYVANVPVNTPVSFQLTAVNNTSGADFYYTTDNERTWKPVSGGLLYLSEEADSGTYKFKAVNKTAEKVSSDSSSDYVVVIDKSDLNIASVDLLLADASIYQGAAINEDVTIRINAPVGSSVSNITYAYARVPHGDPQPSAMDTAVWTKFDGNECIINAIAANAGDYDYYVKAVSKNGANGRVVSAGEIFIDVVNPTLNFDTPIQDADSNYIVTAHAADDQDVNPTISYQIVRKGDPASTQEADWITLNSTATAGNMQGDIKVDQEGTYIVYLRAKDAAGNVTYKNTRDIIVDKVDPVIEVKTPINDPNETIYFGKKIIASDIMPGSGLQSLTVNGMPASSFEPYIKGKGTHTIVATDKAGRTATVTITIEGLPAESDVVGTPEFGDLLDEIGNTYDSTVNAEQWNDYQKLVDKYNRLKNKAHTMTPVGDDNGLGSRSIKVKAKDTITISSDITADANFPATTFVTWDLLKKDTNGDYVSQLDGLMNGNTAAISIPNANKTHEGIYRLDIIDDSGAYTSCEFMVEVELLEQTDFTAPNPAIEVVYDAGKVINLSFNAVGALTYRLDTDTILDMDADIATNGKLTVKSNNEVGKTEVTVTAAGNDIYAAKTISFFINVKPKISGGLSFDSALLSNYVYGDTLPTGSPNGLFTPVVVGRNPGAISYETDPTNIIRIDQNGNGTIIGTGKVKVTAVVGAQDAYGEERITKEITVAKKPLQVQPQDITITYGDAIPDTCTLDPSYLSDIVPGDTIGSNPTCTTNANGSSLPGTYTLSFDGFQNPANAINHYDITGVPAVLNITALTPTLADIVTEPNYVSGTWVNTPIVVKPGAGYDKINVNGLGPKESYSLSTPGINNYQVSLHKNNGAQTADIALQVKYDDQKPALTMKVERISGSSILGDITNLINGSITSDDVRMTFTATDQAGLSLPKLIHVEVTEMYADGSLNELSRTVQELQPAAGNSSHVFSDAIDLTASKRYQIEAYAQDEAGNKSTVVKTTVVIDKNAPQPPVVTGTDPYGNAYIGDGAHWSSGPVTIELKDNAGTPTSSGVHHFEYRDTDPAASGSWTTISSISDITTSGTYEFRTISNADPAPIGALPTVLYTVQIDEDDPVFDVNANADYIANGVNNKDVTFTFTQNTPNTSGVVYEYSIDNWATVTTLRPGENTLILNQNMNDVVYKFRAVSGAGLVWESNDVKTVSIDKIRLSRVSVTMNPNVMPTNSDVTFTLSGGVPAADMNQLETYEYFVNADPNDPAPGVNDAGWKAMNLSNQPLERSLVVTRESENGTYYFRAKAKSGAVSSSVSRAYTVTIDKTAPAAPSIQGNSISNTGTYEIEITPDPSENVTLYYQIVQAGDTPNANNYQMYDDTRRPELTLENRYQVFAIAKDQAGNASAAVSTPILIVDKIPPVITGVSEGETYHLTRTITASDTGSQLASVTHSVNGAGNAKPASFDVNPPVNTNQAVHKVTAVDNAGKQTEVNFIMERIPLISEVKVTPDFEELLKQLEQEALTNGTAQEKLDVQALRDRFDALKNKLHTVTVTNLVSSTNDIHVNVNDVIEIEAKITADVDFPASEFRYELYKENGSTPGNSATLIPAQLNIVRTSGTAGTTSTVEKATLTLAGIAEAGIQDGTYTLKVIDKDSGVEVPYTFNIVINKKQYRAVDYTQEVYVNTAPSSKFKFDMPSGLSLDAATLATVKFENESANPEVVEALSGSDEQYGHTLKAGTEKIKVTLPQTNEYDAKVVYLNVTVKPLNSGVLNLAAYKDGNPVSKFTYGDTNTSVVLEGSFAGRTPIYKTDPVDVATIANDGTLNILKAGDVIVTATLPQTPSYNAETITATITIDKAMLYVKALDAQKTAGNANPAFVLDDVFAQAQLKYSDTMTSVMNGRTVQFTTDDQRNPGTAADTSSPAGSKFWITPSAVTPELDNYQLVPDSSKGILSVVAPQGNDTYYTVSPMNAGAANWVKGPVTITAKAGYEVKVGNTGTYQPSVDLVTYGSQNYQLTFKELSSQIETTQITRTFKIDNQAPVITNVGLQTVNAGNIINSIVSMSQIINYVNGDVELTVDADDAMPGNNSGISTYQMDIIASNGVPYASMRKNVTDAQGNVDPNANVFTLQSLPADIYTVETSVIDAVGNISAVTYTTLAVDTAQLPAPVVTGTYTDTSNTSGNVQADHIQTKWMDKEVKITLSPGNGSDEMIEKYQYKLSTEPDSAYADITLAHPEITLPQSGSNGSFTYSFRAVSKTGNPGSAVSYTIKKDATVPYFSVGATTADGNNYTGSITDQNINITLTPNAAPVSNVTYYYQVDGSGSWNPMGTSLSITTDMNNAVYRFMAKTEAGKEYFSSSSVTINRESVTGIDVVVNTGSFHSGDWTKQAVAASLSTTSNAQIKTYAVSFNGGAYMDLNPANSTLISSYLMNQNGTYSFKAISKSGLESAPENVIVNIDPDTPVIEGVVQGGKYYLKRTVSIHDDISGIYRAEYKGTDGVAHSISKTSTSTPSNIDIHSLIFATPDTYMIEAVDQAKNTTSVSFTYTGLPDHATADDEFQNILDEIDHEVADMEANGLSPDQAEKDKIEDLKEEYSKLRQAKHQLMPISNIRTTIGSTVTISSSIIMDDDKPADKFLVTLMKWDPAISKYVSCNKQLTQTSETTVEGKKVRTYSLRLNVSDTTMNGSYKAAYMGIQGTEYTAESNAFTIVADLKSQNPVNGFQQINIGDTVTIRLTGELSGEALRIKNNPSEYSSYLTPVQGNALQFTAIQEGTVVLQLESPGNTKYKAASAEFVVVIGKKSVSTLMLNVDKTSVNYNGTASDFFTFHPDLPNDAVNPIVTYQVDDGGSNVLSVNADGTSVVHNAGTAKVKAIVNSDNYAEMISNEIQVSVKKKDLVLIAKDVTIAFNQDIPASFDTDDATWSALAPGDQKQDIGTPVYVTSAVKGSAPGDYDILPADSFINSGHQNYNLKKGSTAAAIGKLTINTPTVGTDMFTTIPAEAMNNEWVNKDIQIIPNPAYFKSVGVDGGSQNTIGIVKTGPLLTNTEGIKTHSLLFKHTSGYDFPATYSFKVDTTKPKFSNFTVSNHINASAIVNSIAFMAASTTTTYGNDVDVSVEVYDPKEAWVNDVSGLNIDSVNLQYFLSSDRTNIKRVQPEGTPEPITVNGSTGAKYTFHLSEQGVYTYTVYAEDNAGNSVFSNLYEENLEIDKEVPAPPVILSTRNLPLMRSVSLAAERAVSDIKWISSQEEQFVSTPSDEKLVQLRIREMADENDLFDINNPSSDYVGIMIDHSQSQITFKLPLDGKPKIGTHYYAVTFAKRNNPTDDESLWKDGYAAYLTVNYDDVKPEITVTPASDPDIQVNGSNITSTKSVPFKFVQTNSNVSAVTYQYKYKNDAIFTHVTPGMDTVTLSRGNQDEIIFRAVNEAGVASDEITYKLTIARDPDVDFTVSTKYDGTSTKYMGDWTNKDVRIDASTSYSGAYEFLYKVYTTKQNSPLPDATWLQTDINDGVTASPSNGEGTYYYYVVMHNTQNNKYGEVEEVMVRLDASKPEVPRFTLTSLTPSTFDNFMNAITFGLYDKTGYRVEIDAADNLGGTATAATGDVTITYEVVQSKYSDPSAAAYAHAGKAPLTFTKNSGDGTYYVYAKACDTAGNCSIANTPAEFSIDTVKPVIKGVPADTSKTYYLSKYITASDGTGSGVKTLEIVKDGIRVDYDDTGAAGTFAVETPLDDMGSYSVIAIDQAGNQSTAAFTLAKMPTVAEFQQDLMDHPQNKAEWAGKIQGMYDELTNVPTANYAQEKAKIDALKAALDQSFTDTLTDENPANPAPKVMIKGDNSSFDVNTTHLIATFDSNDSSYDDQLSAAVKRNKVLKLKVTSGSMAVTQFSNAVKIMIPKDSAVLGAGAYYDDGSGALKPITAETVNGVTYFTYMTTKLPAAVILTQPKENVDPFAPYANIDIDNDGTADINLDPTRPLDINIPMSDGDALPLMNIDTNGDGKPDLNVDTNHDHYPDLNVVEITAFNPKDKYTVDSVTYYSNADYLPKINVNTVCKAAGSCMSSYPELDIDADSDYKADINVSKDNKLYMNIAPGVDWSLHWNPVTLYTTEHGFTYGTIAGAPYGSNDTDKVSPKWNYDSNNTGIPDLNITFDGVSSPVINIDSDYNGIPEANIDGKATGSASINKLDDTGNVIGNRIDVTSWLPKKNVAVNGFVYQTMELNDDGTIPNPDDGNKPDPNPDDGNKPDPNPDDGNKPNPDPDNGNKPNPNPDDGNGGNGTVCKGDVIGPAYPGPGKPLDPCKPNVNIDIDNDGTPDINIDVDGDGIPDYNIDTDYDGVPDKNIIGNTNVLGAYSQGGMSGAATGDTTNVLSFILLVCGSFLMLLLLILRKKACSSNVFKS